MLASIFLFSRIHLPCALFFLLAKMDGEVAGAKVKMMIREDNTTSVHAITLRVTRSLITNVLLIWSIHYGLELATQTKEYIDCEWDFHVGILTMVLGYVLCLLNYTI